MKYMFMRLHVWWYEHFVKSEAFPPDIREYIVRRSWKRFAQEKNLAPQVQEELATKELAAALSDDDNEYLSPEFKTELLADAMHRFGQIPLEHCAACKGPVLVHKAIIMNGKYYCESCAAPKKN